MATKNNNTELTVQESRELLLNPVYQQQKKFEIQQRMAQMYVASTIVPDTYRGNIGNCVIAIDMAMRMQANPLMVMQNLYVVHGTPSWSAKFLISCINSSGRFTPLRYQFAGKRGTEQYGCRAFAYEANDREHKEPLYGVWITMDMANKEGWTKKSGSKWLTMPDQMLIYRAAAFWQRAYAPEISMGFLTKEEIEDGSNYEEVSVIETSDHIDSENQDTEAPAQDTPSEDVIAQAMSRQATSNAKNTAQQLHEEYMRKKAEEEAAAEQEAVDKETGEIFNEQ